MHCSPALEHRYAFTGCIVNSVPISGTTVVLSQLECCEVTQTGAQVDSAWSWWMWKRRGARCPSLEQQHPFSVSVTSSILLTDLTSLHNCNRKNVLDSDHEWALFSTSEINLIRTFCFGQSLLALLSCQLSCLSTCTVRLLTSPALSPQPRKTFSKWKSCVSRNRDSEYLLPFLDGPILPCQTIAHAVNGAWSANYIASSPCTSTGFLYRRSVS